MVRDRESDAFKGFAYVQVNTAEQLQKMLSLQGVVCFARFHLIFATIVGIQVVTSADCHDDVLYDSSPSVQRLP